MPVLNNSDFLINFNSLVKKFARSTLRLQLLKKISYSFDTSPFIKLEEEYYEKLKSQLLQFSGQIIEASSLARKIFLFETKRRIRIQERDINFHCPDCLYLIEKNGDFICEKGIDPAKVKDCEEFSREHQGGWSQYINNQKDRLYILKEILEKEDFLFDFSCLDAKKNVVIIKDCIINE